MKFKLDSFWEPVKDIFSSGGGSGPINPEVGAPSSPNTTNGTNPQNPSSFGQQTNQAVSDLVKEMQKRDPNNPNYSFGPQSEKGKQGYEMFRSLYGEDTSAVGPDAQDFSRRTKENLDKDSISARNYLNAANQRLARSNMKAGLRGIDTAGMQEELYRKANYDAQAQNQAFKQQMLAKYGSNIGARQQGATALILGYENVGVAGQQAPRVDYGSGFSLFNPSSWI